MLTDDQVARIVVGLDDMTDRGLLGKDKAADLTDRVHRVGPEGSRQAGDDGNTRRWWRRWSCR